jgi:hypothetical protein
MKFRYEEDLYPFKLYMVRDGKSSIVEARKEARQWCMENASSDWSVEFDQRPNETTLLVQFANRDDALRFKLGFS